MSALPALTKVLKYTHISMLKKYNFQNHDRYKHADKYIADHKFEHIKNYYFYYIDNHKVPFRVQGKNVWWSI